MKDFFNFVLFGLLILIIIYVFVRLTMVLTTRSGKKMMKEINVTLSKATPATATIMSVEKPSVILRKPRMGSIHALLTLEVSPPGGEIFTTTTHWQVNQLSLQELQPGTVIPVKIDADKPTTIYPDVSWAIYNWSQQNVS